MNLAYLYKTLRIFLTCLIFWAAASSYAHATEHGHDPHEHDGVVCMLYGAQEQVTAIQPDTPSISTPITQSDVPHYIPYGSAEITPVQSRAPPQRGPPS